MNELEKLRVWKQLKDMVAKIYDLDTRRMYYRALLVRATNEWGFNPEKPSDTNPNFEYIELDDWEKEFVEDIKDSIIFGFNVRGLKSLKTDSECRKSMIQFIHEGGTLSDIPENFRCPAIDTIYRECFQRHHNELLNLADYVINKG